MNMWRSVSCGAALGCVGAVVGPLALVKVNKHQLYDGMERAFHLILLWIPQSCSLLFYLFYSQMHVGATTDYDLKDRKV